MEQIKSSLLAVAKGAHAVSIGISSRLEALPQGRPGPLARLLRLPPPKCTVFTMSVHTERVLSDQEISAFEAQINALTAKHHGVRIEWHVMPATEWRRSPR